MELLKVIDIMELCGISKKRAIQLAKASGAIVPGRVKNGTIYVVKSKFIKWLGG